MICLLMMLRLFFSLYDINTNSSVEIVKCDRFGESVIILMNFLDEWTKQLVTLV